MLTHVVHLVEVQLWYSRLRVKRLILHGMEQNVNVFIFGPGNGLVKVCD